MNKPVRLLSSALALTLFLSACGGESGQESGSDAAEEQTSEQASEEESTADTDEQTKENNEGTGNEEASDRENDEAAKEGQQENTSNQEQASEAEQTSADDSSDDSSAEDEAPEETPSDADKGDTNATVTNVVDGDTIDVDYEGSEERIRLILVDTPETKHPQMGVQPFGPEAAEFTTGRLNGEKVRLEPGVEERDYYGRLLAYVFIDGENFNQQLIEEGLARVAVYPPNTKYLDEFEAAEQQARSAGIGIWSLEDYVTDDGYAEQDGDEEDSGDSSGSEETDSSSGSTSPDMDCADFDTQSEAQEHWNENGYSADNDPDRLDGDGDGVPCDTLPSGSDSSDDGAASSSDSGSEENSDSSEGEDVYYENCDAAREAGAAPVREGDPGYGGHLDRDGDGTGCET